jgi:NAD(P)-dependent dehydrogenase (short-subunit alcohol dehydrogenase family)
MTNTIYLITGASRGIGRALTETFLAHSNTTVITAVREPVYRSLQVAQLCENACVKSVSVPLYSPDLNLIVSTELKGAILVNCIQGSRSENTV